MIKKKRNLGYKGKRNISNKDPLVGKWIIRLVKNNFIDFIDLSGKR